MISVVIPAFNCEAFLCDAVESALMHECVTEVIIVEDCSSDSTLSVAEGIQEKYPDIVCLYTHPAHENKGASASRNLGILKSSNKFIAFLDGDDLYLENRFEKDLEILKDPEVDGVYNAMGLFYSDDDGKDRYIDGHLTTLSQEIEPSQLFWQMSPMGDKGHFSCNTLTIKKSSLTQVGLFDVDLLLSQDTHMWIKLSIKSKLVAGNINSPVAMRRFHIGNRSKYIDKLNYYRPILLLKALVWAESEKVNYKIRNYICYKYCFYCKEYKNNYIKNIFKLYKYKSFWSSLIKKFFSR